MNCPYCIKVCTKCGEILVANSMNFYKKKRGKYGLQAFCKECTSKKNEEYYENNKEYRKEYHKEYYENNKEEIKEKNKEYRENHKEKIKEWYKEWYKENKDERNKYCKEWRQNNPEKTFNNHQKRRQLQENQGEGLTKEQWIDMMEFFDWKCAYSGEYIGGNSKFRTIDHIVALNNGGENEVWNCVPMHKSYNSSKHANDMLEWYMQQEFFNIDRLRKIFEWCDYAFEKWGNQ